MGMAHSTSGRTGFEPLLLTSKQKLAIEALGDQVNDSIILSMLKRENELKLSPAVLTQ